MTGEREIDWAGVRFLALGHHDGRMVRAPGLFAFVRREAWAGRTMLFVDYAERIAARACSGDQGWDDALGLGMNEVHVCLGAKARLDGLQLRAHLIKRLEPVLNVLEPECTSSHPPPTTATLWARKRG